MPGAGQKVLQRAGQLCDTLGSFPDTVLLMDWTILAGLPAIALYLVALAFLYQDLRSRERRS